MTPWLSIWVRPRQTIRRIVERDPRQGVLPIVLAAGAVNSLTFVVVFQLVTGPAQPIIPVLLAALIVIGLCSVFTFFGLGVIAILLTVNMLWWMEGVIEFLAPVLYKHEMVSGAVVTAGLGMVCGVIGLYLFGWLCTWVGSWFGGQAKRADVRAALAWVEIPTLVVFSLWILTVLVVVLTLGGLRQIVAAQLSPIWFALSVAACVAWLWRAVLTCNTLAAVQTFSAWRGLGTAVVSIVPLALVLLGTMMIPNILRSHPPPYETILIGNLRALMSTLEMYRSKHTGYPDAWLDDLYVQADPDFGPPSFNLDLQAPRQTVQGYIYRYSPLPAGCVEPNCSGYTIAAIPKKFKDTGTRSFFVDQAGFIHHCTGATGADATDATIDVPPKSC